MRLDISLGTRYPGAQLVHRHEAEEHGSVPPSACILETKCNRRRRESFPQAPAIMQSSPAVAVTVAASPAFAVSLPVLVEDVVTGVRCRGALQLPRRATHEPPGKPSGAVLARLAPLLRAHGDALDAQTEGLDPERLSRTYAALMAALQEAAGMRVDAVELTPATLRDVLPACGGGRADRAQLAELPEGLRALAGELRELKVESTRLAEVPDEWVGELTRLEVLNIGAGGYGVRNTELRALPASLGQLGALKQLTLCTLTALEEMPDTLGRMTSLTSLTMDHCEKLKTLPASIGQLGALKQLTLCGLDALEEMPDTLGRLTSLEDLTLTNCRQLKALPASIMLLSRLQHLEIDECPLQDMPCIEILTALRTLYLDITDYTHGSRAFKSLSRSLPCLQQLDNLRLSGRAEAGNRVAIRTEDVLAVGRALRAWPLPLLRDVQHDDAQPGIRLSTCWQALGLPAAAADWSNATTLEFFRVQQHKVAAFASGMHARLGAASGVAGLDEQTLVMIADEVLGGWGLLREWRQHSEHAGDEGAGAEGGGANGT